MDANYTKYLSTDVKLNIDSLAYYCSYYASYISPYLPPFVNTVKSSSKAVSYIIVDPTENVRLNMETLPDDLLISDEDIHEYIKDNAKYLNNGLNYIYDFTNDTYKKLREIYVRLMSINNSSYTYPTSAINDFIKNYNLRPTPIDVIIVAKYYDNFIYRTDDSLKELIYKTLKRNALTYQLNKMDQESKDKLNTVYDRYITGSYIYTSYIVTIPRYNADDNLILENPEEYIEIFNALGYLSYTYINYQKEYDFPPLIHKYIYPDEMKKNNNDYVWIYNSYFDSADECIIKKWKEQNSCYTIDDIKRLLNLIGGEYKKLFNKIIFYNDNV